MNTFYFLNSVLIVDDEPFILKTTSAILSRLGFQHILTADNVEQAIQILNQACPPVQLILSDLNMPDVDGLELLRLLDSQSYRNDIVLFSGEDAETLKMAESLAKARNLLVLGAIEKPINADKFMGLLQSTQKTIFNNTNHEQSESISAEILKQAIIDREIEPWFQPKVSIATKQAIGVEVLARWPESKLGRPIYPDEFIPVAEDNGLIDELTFLIGEKSYQYNQQWKQLGIDLNIAINMSMESLENENFPEILCQHLQDFCQSAGKLTLEVTESRIRTKVIEPLETLLRFRMKKVGLSIDDFGTGHSNLGQLRDLPFDELKLDRSYVKPDKNHDKNQIILESIIQMAKQLGLKVVAEGVETLDDWNNMQALECDLVQGYFIARPMPGNELIHWMENWPELSERLFKS